MAGWKWFKFLRVANEASLPAASAMGNSTPMWATAEKSLHISDGTSWAKLTMPAGAVSMHAGASAPSGWLLCDGSAVSRTTYANLFAAISTAFGAGDGSTTFNIPDMRGAAPAGVGTSTGYTQNETIALATKYNDQMQGHFHEVNQASATYGVTNAANSTTYGSIRTDATPDRLPTAARNPASDGTNGTPRTGTTTRGKRLGMNFIIKF